MSHGAWKDMFKAVQNNDFDLVEFYIKQGIDINYQHPEYFTTALIESIRLGFHNMTKLLLENGAQVDIKEIYSNKNAKQIAQELNNFEALELLE
jgi:ankyrin repeat protein